MSTPLIEMNNIEKHFGPVIALGGVSFDVLEGECHRLLGANGAGNSPLLKALSLAPTPHHATMRPGATPAALARPRYAVATPTATG